MSEQKKYVSRDFQRIICVGKVISEPELKVMKPFREGEDGTPYCSFTIVTGAPFGDSNEVLIGVKLKGKPAENFCREPRKGHKFLFDGQLSNYTVEKEGSKYPDRRYNIVGTFNYIEPKVKEDTQAAPPPAQIPPKPLDKEEDKDEDVPF